MPYRQTSVLSSLRQNTSIVLLLAALFVAPPALDAEECGARSSFLENDLLDPTARCELERWAGTTGTSALVVTIGSEPVFEWQAERARQPLHVMSITKSVASLAIGRMLLDGSLTDLDLPLAELFPEWRQGQKQEITLRHLLTHSTGIQDVPNAGLEVEPSPDVVALALAAELTEPPGETFRYNNKASNLLSEVVARRTGESLDDYLRHTVFADLEIESPEWLKDAAGSPYTMAGLFLTAHDLTKIGQLMLEGGQWQGRAVVASEFVQTALEPQRADDDRVGLFWWLFRGPPAGFQANGWLGQWLIVIPEYDLVAVRLVDREDARKHDEPRRFLELILETLAPASLD